MRARSASFLLALATLLTLVNLLVFVVGIRWVRGLLQGLSEGTHEEGLEAAVTQVQSASGTLDLLLQGFAWFGGAALLLVIGALVLQAMRQVRRGRRVVYVGSYWRNMRRARRRAHRHARRHCPGPPPEEAGLATAAAAE